MQRLPSHEALERGRLPPLVAGDAGAESVRTPSLLRASLGVRLALVAVALGVLWLAVAWALT
jgi:hypothetical protein